MVSKKWSQFDDATLPLSGSETMVGLQAGKNVKFPASALLTTERRALDLQLIRYKDGELRYGHNGGIGWESQSNVTTDISTGTVYAIYINGFNEPVISQKRVDSPQVEIFNLAPIFGFLINDPHNGFSIALDADGYIWVSGNMHAAPLLLARSQVPRDITTFSAKTLPGSNVSISYPVLLRLPPDDTLVFFIRRGSSGNGTDYLLRYNTTTQTWTDLGAVLDGDTDNVSAYMQRIAFGDAGVVTIMFTWRVTTNPNSNYGVYHARISGLTGGGTMAITSSTGATIVAPMRPGPEVVPSPVGPSSHYAERVIAVDAPNIINNGGLDIDRNGYVHSMFTVQAVLTDANPLADNLQDMTNQGLWSGATPYAVADRITSGGVEYVCLVAHTNHVPPNATYWRLLATGESLQLKNAHTTQWVHVYNDATGWHFKVVTNFGAFSSFSGSTPGPGNRQQVICTADGRTFFVGYWPGHGLLGALWAHEVTPGLPYYPQRPFKLLDIPDGGFFSIDAEALRELNLLRWVVGFAGHRYWANPGNTRLHTGELDLPSGEAELPTGYAAPGAFAAAYGLDPADGLVAVGSLDLAAITDFQRGLVRFPSIRTVASVAAENLTITTSTPGLVGLSFPVSAHWAGLPLYVRLSVQMQVTGGSGFAAAGIRVQRDLAYQLNAKQKINRESPSTPAGVNDPSGGTPWAQTNTMATVFVTNGSQPTIHKTTAWCSLTSLDLVGPYQEYGSPIGALGIVHLVGWRHDGSISAQIDHAVIELGTLEL